MTVLCATASHHRLHASHCALSRRMVQRQPLWAIRVYDPLIDLPLSARRRSALARRWKVRIRYQGWGAGAHRTWSTGQRTRLLIITLPCNYRQ